jgi:hypothetical protein
MYKSLNITFYQNVAKLFYAVAASDKVVRKEEFDELKSLVKQEWLIVDDAQDPYMTDAAYQIEIVFDWLTENKLDADSCYNEFVAYKREHNYFFTSDLNRLILKTANAIASAFFGKNKSELTMIEKLSNELEK